MNSALSAKLLIVDDETAHMTALCDTLQDAGFATTGFSSAHKALAALREQEFDLVLTDLMMPEMDGIALLREAQRVDPHVVAIVMTGHGAIDTAVEAMKAGAIDYIQKPFRLSKIQPVLGRALMVRRLRTENIQLRQAVAIHELTTTFTHEHDWRTVAAKAVEAAFDQSEQGSASMLTLTPDERELVFAAARGRDAERISALRLPFDDAFKQWVATSRALVGRAQLLDVPPAPLGGLNLGTSIPMLAGGKFVGILNFALGHADRTPTLGQLKTLSGLANAAASALEIALLLDQLHRANQGLEQRVRQRTTQLEAANKEMEAFSYSVSHDLRAPLRAIDGYAAILVEDSHVELAPQTRQSATAIRTAAQRALQLIADLLEFSKLGSQPLCKRTITIAALAKEVADELLAAHAHRQIDIQWGTLPDCVGDESLLRQVWVNLLSNAVKFTRQRQQTLIAVDAYLVADETVYRVRDNGAGFSMQQADKLFGVFQRLHSNRDFEGTGIGLSIVQRIVAKHGGRVWAEGERDVGATFYFSLPSSPD